MSSYFESKLADLFETLNDSDDASSNLKKALRRRKKKPEKLKEKKFVSPMARIPRNAMGEYIVPPGGKPLTSLDCESPGPSTYTPSIDYTHESAPQYSIASAAKKKAKPESGAPPTVGPDSYTPKGKDTGDNGPKYSIGIKHVDTGPPNLLVTPTDTMGFETPGPEYLPSEKWGEGPGHSFGVIHKVKTDDLPGPAEYPAHEPDKGLIYSLGNKPISLEWNGVLKRCKEPAPNTYKIESAIGKGIAISMLGRLNKNVKSEGASPATFFVKRKLNTNGALMTYRAIEREAEKRPDPASYTLDQKPCTHQKTTTTFACRRNCCPTFPDFPTDMRKTKIEVPPGPAEYSRIRNFNKNDNPSYSMGNHLKVQQDDNPSPAEYTVQKNDGAPAYSMAKRLQKPITSNETNPSPNSYTPKLPENAPVYSIICRRKPKMPEWRSPAPNTYDQTVRICKRTGPAFKSRASPWVYSGFKANGMI